MLGYARFRAAFKVGFYPLYEKPPARLVDFYWTKFVVVCYYCFKGMFVDGRN